MRQLLLIFYVAYLMALRRGRAYYHIVSIAHKMCVKMSGGEKLLCFYLFYLD